MATNFNKNDKDLFAMFAGLETPAEAANHATTNAAQAAEDNNAEAIVAEAVAAAAADEDVLVVDKKAAAAAVATGSVTYDVKVGDTVHKFNYVSSKKFGTEMFGQTIEFAVDYAWTFCWEDGAQSQFHGPSVELPDEPVVVWAKALKPRARDFVFAIGDFTPESWEFYAMAWHMAMQRNHLKDVSTRKADKAAKQRTRSYRMPMFKASDFLDTNASTTAGLKLGEYKPTMLPDEANLYLGGIGAAMLPELYESNAACTDKGKLLSRSVKDATKFPAVMVEYDLIDSNEWVDALVHQLHDSMVSEMKDTLTLTLWNSLCSKMDALFNGREYGEPMSISFSGHKYYLACQSAAWAKKKRSCFMREDVFAKWLKVAPAGANLEGFHNVVKPFYYLGLLFTGLTEYYLFDEFRKWWDRAIVVDDMEVAVSGDAFEVGNGLTQEEVDDLGEDFTYLLVKDYISRGMHTFDLTATDGGALMGDDLCDWLKSKGLSKDLCQVRAPWLKGMLFHKTLPSTGTVKDYKGVVHNWADVSLVIPKSVFKGWKAYDSFESYLRLAQPAFGWVQPSARERTTNGQCLDTLMLPRDVFEELSKGDRTYYNRVTKCTGDFNLEALKLALKSAAMEGINPAKMAKLAKTPAKDAKGKELGYSEAARVLRTKVTDWERGFSRRVNTYHFKIADSYNQYLAYDLDVFVRWLSGEFEFSDGAKRNLGADDLGRKGDVRNGVRLTHDEVCCMDLPEGLVLLQRNPSTSRHNNVVVLNHHTTWGLHGAVHFAIGSLAAECLNGADFDGDQVMATTNDLLVSWADTHADPCPIVFDRTAGGYERSSDASFAEMTNYTFQSFAQVGAAMTERANASRFNSYEEFVEWSNSYIVWADAGMARGVDEGKGGMKHIPMWQAAYMSFLFRFFLLPGWKYTKDPAAAWADAKEAAIKFLLSNGRSKDELTDEMVCDHLVRKFAVCKCQDENGKWFVYDPCELVSTRDANGRKVAVQTEKFSHKAIDAVLASFLDCYYAVWAVYGNELAEAGYDDKVNA